MPEEKNQEKDLLLEKKASKKKRGRLVFWLIFVIIFLIIFFTVTSSLLAYSLLGKTYKTPSTGAQEIQNNHSKYYGTITGSLSYPSEFIPPMIICAENTETAESFCTYEIEEESNFTYGLGYQIEAPSGTYNVYAQLIGSKKVDAEPNENYKAYYSEFITCGINTECESHEKIDVQVKGGEMVSDVDPQDWYIY